ncbi:hypothetical protein BDA96_06G060200 [Sorghum bicolor]|uniref:Uncharacterized protein n=3 Tax=Sorghum bicolor TaxID=4558 RepID=A0A921QNU8_SORBI|nr:hypothetical protein BDA96_06G060200 [Sorghum bicolor]OQU81412.1 hypothetical protein SORBI_3006G053651 [Sorghum bicolor]
MPALKPSSTNVPGSSLGSFSVRRSTSTHCAAPASSLARFRSEPSSPALNYPTWHMEAVTATALLVAAMATVPTARRVTQLATRGLPLAFRSQPSCAASCTSCPPSYPSSVADLVASSVAPRHRSIQRQWWRHHWGRAPSTSPPSWTTFSSPSSGATWWR